MKQPFVLFALLVSTPVAFTQRSAKPFESMKDPVTSIMRTVVYRQANNLIAMAEEMPEEKYGYKPTLQPQSFAQLVIDVTQTNNSFCAVVGDIPGSELDGPKQTERKEKLVAALRASFTLCKTALEKLHDNQLGDTVPFSREGVGPRSAALLLLLDMWADSYRMAFVCLRLNGQEPPEKEPEFAPRPTSQGRR